MSIVAYTVFNLLVIAGLICGGLSQYLVLYIPFAVCVGLVWLLVESGESLVFWLYVVALVLSLPPGAYLSLDDMPPFVLATFLWRLLLSQMYLFPAGVVVVLVAFAILAGTAQVVAETLGVVGRILKLLCIELPKCLWCIPDWIWHEVQIRRREWAECELRSLRVSMEKERGRRETEKRQSNGELRDLKDALAKEQHLAQKERGRREEAERRRDSMKAQCRKLIATTESSLRSTEAEILELQHCGDPCAGEELAKLAYRENGLLLEIVDLRNTLTNLEQK